MVMVVSADGYDAEWVVGARAFVSEVVVPLYRNERDVIPDEYDFYNTCQLCLDTRDKNRVSVAVYKLPGNP